ncbi:apolipoprotein N-acyltransferase [Aquabacter cavernae]|uniref:apolipoprotein N-acyltransferase n=1 Tax=Aquabacter cavernae TaxID=2496029 RepID=UPI000F8D9332|nr:apolipoprotein N-acyltransferase [Aquabacter cavernae]
MSEGARPGAVDRVRRLQGWRRWLFAFGAGAVSALSTAPFGLWPILFLTFPALILLLDGPPSSGWRAIRAAAATGWWFGFGYFLASLWWIGNAFLVEAGVFAWLLPFAVVSLPAGLALFSALGLATARLLWSRGPMRVGAFAFGLGGAEWLRGHVLTGFPWNTFGYALAENLALAQSAALVGLWGLTLAAILIFAAPILLLDGSRRARLLGPALAAAVLLVAFGWGSWRLAQPAAPLLPGVHLRIMQPALPQDQKFAYGERQRILDDYLALSAQPSQVYPGGLKDVSVLIWPESAFPFVYEREPWARERIEETLPDTVILVTGAARYGPPPPGQTSFFYNSIRVMDGHGTVLQNADKVHLVPFGEYLPFQRVMEEIGFEQLTRQRGGFASGLTLKPLLIPGLPTAAPLICYEAIFPGAVIPEGERPGFLLNVTNDAWFGATPGPYQHFLQARLRAIEEGLPLVRAANTGISAVIDPVGRIVASLSLGEKGNLDVGLPPASDIPPPAAGHPHLAFLLLLIMTFIIALNGLRKS